LVRIRETQFLRLKTAGSSDDILVDKEALQELKALGKPQAGQFVIAGEELSTRCKTIRSYRCAAVFDSLVQWLRSRGISSNKPIHELRKEVGAHIATNDGLYQASRFLRHSDVSTTARHYIDLKNKPRPGLGKLLKPA
jgi:integrase